MAEYWPVQATSPVHVPLTPTDISKHLLQDWMPSLPASVGESFVGWPPHLLMAEPYKGVDVLCLRDRAGATERQWKGFLSWMLGIAGTRHVLRRERYRWIAPVSAFLESLVKPVALGKWPAGMGPGALVVRRSPVAKSKLMPDYLALRSTAGGARDWAVVESKGTRDSVAGQAECPARWYNQARNAFVYIEGRRVRIDRHIVVATRVNPNASTASGRRLQLRAWNSDEGSDEVEFAPPAVTDMVSAHMFGVMRAARMVEVARALAHGAEWRALRARRRSPELVGRHSAIVERARSELDARQALASIVEGSQSPVSIVRIPFERESAVVEVRLDETLLRLARALCTADDYDEAADAVKEADSELDQRLQPSIGEFGEVFDGIEVEIRHRFDA
jgi:hypothetical protein